MWHSVLGPSVVHLNSRTFPHETLYRFQNLYSFAAYTDVLFFPIIPEKDGSLSFDPALSKQQASDLVKGFVEEAQKHKVNPVFSVGGWTASQQFSNLAATAASRHHFAQSLVNFAKQHRFTGLDLDWEYPNGDGIGCNTKRPTDVVNFGLLVKEIRALWPEGELSAAVSLNGFNGATGLVATAEETALLAKNLDYINLMAYDVYGLWSKTSGPIAPLDATCADEDSAQSVKTGFQIALKQGFKASQVLLGIPGYAKRFQLTSSKLVPKIVGGNKASFYYQQKTATMPPGGAFDDKAGKNICGVFEGAGGSYLVNELISNGYLAQDQSRGLGGYRRHFDNCSGQPFLVSKKYLISYDDKASTVLKAKFAKKNKMGGIYFFDTMGPAKETVREARKVFSN
ncbi:hypothetical protein PtB15_2B490 [Puccinia triticina]|nr:hypothetical protein PtB15_2B490 [Puccinia triticina]